MLAAWLLALLVQSPVDGLRPGERVLAAPAAAFDEALAAGRLIDATTGRPVAGAEVEAWTEDWDDEAVLVDRAISAADGGFALARRRGEHEAEKLRVRSRAHRTTTRTFSALGEPLLLVPRPAPIALRVVDIEGRPIPGARLRTHQSCAHAPPAAAAVADELGRLRVEDFPPLGDWPEAQVEADGFGALYDAPFASLLTSAPGRLDALPVVRLGRRPPLTVRLLDEDGAPLAGARLVLGTAPLWFTARTAADGRALFRALPAERWLVLQRRDASGELYLAELPGWLAGPDSEIALRVDGRAYPGESPDDAVLVLEAGDEDPEHGFPHVLALHDDGWSAYGAGEHEFPPGRVRIFVGGPFTGWAAWRGEVVLAPGERRTLPADARREPELVLRLAGDEPWRITVESAGDSIADWFTKEARIPVPPGRPLVVLAEGAHEVRRLRVAPLAADGVLSVEQGEILETRRPPRSDAARTARLRFALSADESESEIEVAIEVIGAWNALEAEGDAIDLPPDAPFEAWIRAPGFVPRCVRGTTPAEGEERRLGVDLARTAAVVLRGPLARALAVGREAVVDDDGALHLADLAPGPLSVALERSDGARLALEIELAPGETRAFTLR